MTEPRRLSVRIAGLLLVAAALAGSFAAATFHDAYRRGLAAERAGRWEEARQALLEAAHKHPEPARRVRTYGLNFLEHYDPYLHLARVELELGLVDEAAEHLDRSRRAAVTPVRILERLARRLELARQREARPVRQASPPSPPPAADRRQAPPPTVLVLDSRPVGADVFIDGRLLGMTPVELPVSPGAHRLEVRAEGHQASRRQIDVAAGERLTLRIELEALRPPVPPARADLSPSPAPTQTPAAATAPVEAIAAASPSQAPEQRPTEPAASPVTVPVSRAAVGAGAADPAPASEPTSVADFAPASESARAALPAHAGEEAAAPSGEENSPPVAAAETPGPPRRPSTLLLVIAAGLGVLVIVVLARRLRRRLEVAADPRTRSALATEGMPRTGLTPTGSGPGVTAAGDGSTFGRFHLLALLGRGGMASTYRARCVGDDREMAIKIPYAHLLEDEEFVARFLREGALGATLHHPNIVRIYQAGEHQKVPFIAMELLAGQTLEQRLAEVDRLDLRVALEIVRGIALALDYAHLKGVVHRDLKPENVMCLPDGGVKVMDYGIARVLDGSNLTASHSFLGTPNYAAPESFDPSRVDGRSDLYSLGIIAYRLLAGRLPFTGSSPLEILDQHRRTPLPPLPEEAAIPPRVEAMVRRLAAKPPASRFESAEALLRELNAILNSLAETSVTEPAPS